MIKAESVLNLPKTLREAIKVSSSLTVDDSVSPSSVNDMVDFSSTTSWFDSCRRFVLVSGVNKITATRTTPSKADRTQKIALHPSERKGKRVQR